MKLPSRDVWVRIIYTAAGSGSALLWNKFLPLRALGGGYIPPAVLASIILLSEDAGQIEKDIAASILGYTCAAQALSFAHQLPEPVSKLETKVEVEQTEVRQNPTSQEQVKKYEKIRNVTSTIGAIADLVGKFKGQS
jgi:hypothetical protein|tara:strand:+ start:232 stop:642 length:411 start_codon:yes stop_codon:yes gene_type:complete